MREYVLNLKGLYSKDKIHARIKSVFAFPEYYGGNLDALHDCLTDIRTPCVITIKNADLAAPEMTDYVERLLTVFKDAADECGKMELHIV